MPYDLS
ncbi:hypothetical protein VTL71DRAFT_7074 [Oculimacula yallundae]